MKGIIMRIKTVASILAGITALGYGYVSLGFMGVQSRQIKQLKSDLDFSNRALLRANDMLSFEQSIELMQGMVTDKQFDEIIMNQD